MHHPCSFIRIDRMSVINRNWRFTPIAGSEFQSILRHSHSRHPPTRSSKLTRRGHPCAAGDVDHWELSKWPQVIKYLMTKTQISNLWYWWHVCGQEVKAEKERPGICWIAIDASSRYKWRLGDVDTLSAGMSALLLKMKTLPKKSFWEGNILVTPPLQI